MVNLVLRGQNRIHSIYESHHSDARSVKKAILNGLIYVVGLFLGLLPFYKSFSYSHVYSHNSSRGLVFEPSFLLCYDYCIVIVLANASSYYIFISEVG